MSGAAGAAEDAGAELVAREEAASARRARVAALCTLHARVRASDRPALQVCNRGGVNM